jgi:hypothetical protein
MFLRIKLFFVFLSWCVKHPKDIGENWEDMKFRYFMETDPEMKKLTKELEDEKL